MTETLSASNPVPGGLTLLVESDGGSGMKTRLSIENNAVEPVDMNIRNVNVALGSIAQEISGPISLFFFCPSGQFYQPLRIYRPGSTNIRNWEVNSSGQMVSYVGGQAGLAWIVAHVADAFHRFTVSEMGGLAWGGGADTPDVVLARVAPGVLDVSGTIRGKLGTRHVAEATPTGGGSGDVLVGNDKLWVNDRGTWKSVPLQ